MVCGENVLGAEEHLLVELLAGADTAKLDLDVGADAETRQADQVSGDVDDTNRLSHVEKKNLAAAAEGACLEDELDCFRDGHEVALHLGMGHRYGPTAADLPQESRHDAATASKNISKSDRDEVAI